MKQGVYQSGNEAAVCTEWKEQDRAQPPLNNTGRNGVIFFATVPALSLRQINFPVLLIEANLSYIAFSTFCVNLTEDQIRKLAPDEASKKVGRDLANPAKWITKGANEIIVWGECQSSGSKPYQAGIDLAALAFNCSCPSRKFPCKHSIALGLLYARGSNGFTTIDALLWITEWLSKRTQKAEANEEKKD